VTADAAHTCVETARYLVEDNSADYLLTIKGNRSSLHAAAIAAGRELICAEPGHVHEERGHGRINRWTTWAADTGEDIDLPHAARLAVIPPRRCRPGRTNRSAKRSRSWSPVAPACRRPKSLLTPGSTGASKTSNTGPATPSGARTASRRITATARGSWPPCAFSVPRPVRHQRHHQDHRDRPGNRPPPHARRPADHITSHPSVTHRL